MDLITIIIACCLVAFLYCLYLLFPQSSKNGDIRIGYRVKRPPEPEKQRLALETISTLWSKRADLELSLRDLAMVWRSNVPVQEEIIEEEITFKHPDLEEFYEKHIKNKAYFSGNVLKATLQIIDLLDKLGDCPSVVQGPGESESQLGRNTYDTLAEVPLYKHSLNVANEIITLISDGPFMPKAIIAALGHDIGKIPTFRDKLYATGDHPLMSMMVLNDIPGFKYIQFSEEVVNAVKMHHKTPPKDKKSFLDDKLKEADQAARRHEISTSTTVNVLEDLGLIKGARMAAEAAKEPKEPAQGKFPKPLPGGGFNFGKKAEKPAEAEPAASIFGVPETDITSAPAQTAPVVPEPAPTPVEEQPVIAPSFNREPVQKEETPAAPRASEPFASMLVTPEELTRPAPAQPAMPATDFFGSFAEEEKEKLTPKEKPVEWFNSQEFIREAQMFINKMYGNRWNAFSMPNGIVYIQTTIVMDIIKKIGRKRRIADIEIAETDEELRKSLLFSVFQQLRSEGNAIAEGFIREGYFNAFFTVKMRDGREFKRCAYIPFQAAFFGKSIAELEATKYGRVADIVDVVPFAEKPAE